jgi:hypothetical protein
LNKVQYDPAVIRPLLVGANDDEVGTHEENLKAGQSYWPWLAILLPLVTNLEGLHLAVDDLQLRARAASPDYFTQGFPDAYSTPS